MSSSPSIPLATYRLQFNREFTFRQAAELVPYLASLGISHCYASPYLRARPGSMHGYDIVDHNSLNPEIGSAEDYEFFVNTLHRHGMKQILDIVPNHMGVMGSDNGWWLDVLENGEASAYSDFFDIDWEPIKEELRGKLLIPVLEDQYGKMLENGDLKLAGDFERGEFSLLYYHHRFPIDPREYSRILLFQKENLQAALGESSDDFGELQSIATAFQNLPSRNETTTERKAERNREKEVQKRRLAALIGRSGEVARLLVENIDALNGVAGKRESFNPLHDLIKAQAFRLAKWRVAADDINYRRFFDINELAALCTENEAVFDATHCFILQLVSQRKVDGLRIDHPDGLYDPAGYFTRLRDRLNKLEEIPFSYVVIEKILTGTEKLRSDWPIDGTTGYDFTNLVNGLFVDPSADSRMERVYRTFIGHQPNYREMVYRSKKLILKVSLASELNVLANALSRIALSDRRTCDFTLNSLRAALAKIIASFPVYRTYITGDQITDEDRQYVEQAVAAARGRGHAADTSVFDFIRDVLLLEANDPNSSSYRRAITRFVMKFQQVTSAVMAKGLEDTAFYRYNRLISLNEVGGDPSRFGVTVDDFHRANQARAQSWPNSMLTTATHDSKRSEDARARINVLSEIPALWRLTLRRWRDWNRSKKRVVEGLSAPSRDDEYMFYQSLIGVWPYERVDRMSGHEWQKFSERIEQFMLKAVREAKHFTSWTYPNVPYEEAVSSFVKSVLRRREKNRFLTDFDEFRRRLSRIGAFNSLSQSLLKFVLPGVPDVYQGSELWDLHLVDPDNRRPVDYDRRKQYLEEIKALDQDYEQRTSLARGLIETMEDGRIKLFLTFRALCTRKSQSDLFQLGSYVPLVGHGEKAGHVVAFGRKHNGHSAIVAVPRLIATLLGEQHANPLGAEVWGETGIQLPEEMQKSAYRNVLTGEAVVPANETSLSAAYLFANFPVALLLSV
jgi:(1->4)-alpha-D-glucan 1-alpha-D-glucosylmutase